MPGNIDYEQEQTAKHYEAYYETKYKRADQLEKRLLTQFFSNFSDVKNVLEVGCGTGHFTRWIESLGLESMGVDKSKSMLKEAKAMWPQGTLLQTEGSRLPFKDKSVDVVAFITSLEFMPNATLAICEAARVGKIGIIIGLMNKNSPSTLKKRIQAARKKSSFYRQAKFYSISDVKNLLKKNPGKLEITFWTSTVFSKPFDNMESSRFPFGAFLGIAIKLRDIL
jgi:ubiquinone/menaquinone biosynthesis C-methylase UbiE